MPVSVVVVIPTYNERDNLEPLIARVFGALPDAAILFVDDGSPDGTGELAEELAGKHPGQIEVLHRTKKEGLGAAYVAGFTHTLERWPDVEFVCQMDADLSHDPAHLPALVEAAREADVAVGSRYVNGVSIVNWPLRRLLISKMASTYARIVTGLPLTDCTGGFKCYRADTLRRIDLPTIQSSGYSFQIETSFRAWRAGLTLKDVPIVFHERQAGASKIGLNIAIEGLLIVARLGLIRLFTRRKQPASN